MAEAYEEEQLEKKTDAAADKPEKKATSRIIGAEKSSK